MVFFTKFYHYINQLPIAYQLWNGLLTLFNLFFPLLFFWHIEAQISIGVFIVNTIAQISLVALLGMTRLICLGHALWIPLVYFLFLQLPMFPLTHPMGIWLRALVAIDSIAIALDFIDTYKYLRGNRIFKS